MLEFDCLDCGSTIVQLMYGKSIIKELFSTAYPVLQTFTSLSPGLYSLRVIADEDNNKKWSTGNY